MPAGLRRRFWREEGRINVALSETDSGCLGLRALAQGSYSRADQVNLAGADTTLLVDCMEGDFLASTRERERRLSDWCRKLGRPLLRSYLSTSEIPRIVEHCRELLPEVLSVVCLQECAEDSQLAALASFFFGELFAEMCRENLLQRKADAVWQRRRIDRLAGKPAHGPGDAGIRSIEIARHVVKQEVFRLLDAIPMDATAKAAIFQTAFQRVAVELAFYLPQRLEKLQATCLRHTLKAVYDLRPEALPARTRAFVRGNPDKEPAVWKKRFGTVLMRHRDPSEAFDGESATHIIRAACQKVAKTRLRADRALRTYLLLELGGCTVASPQAQIILRKLTREAANDHLGFRPEQLKERFRDIQVPGQSAGWASVLRLGKYLGDRWQRLSRNDPFKQILERRDTDEIETELFYFVDEFTINDSLWTQQHLVGFAHALCWLCEDREDRWRQWLGLSASAASVAY